MTYNRQTGDPGKRFQHHLMALRRDGYTSTALARAGESTDSCAPDEWLVARELWERLQAGLRPEYLEALLSDDAHSHVVRMARQAAFRILARINEEI